MTDVFSNPSNDYVYPNLSPCPNNADDQNLIWDKTGLTIIKGSQEIANIDFSDLNVPVSAYSKQQKIVESGEVTFIQGLTKGLCNRQQGFTLPSLVSTDEDNNSLFMQIDLSINYYNNFRYIVTNKCASSYYDNGVDIASAMNIVFDANSIKTFMSYDPSILTFSGSLEGYEYNITNVKLTLIDTSENSLSCFPNGQNSSTYTLTEDASYNILSAKYPNTGMQGIIIKSIFPNETEEDNWFYINHTSDYVTTYDASIVDSSIYYIKKQRILDVGLNGCSNDTYISAGDYLDYITNNNMWNKAGEVYIWMTAPDYTDCTLKNLITGFYVFNPHTFPIKIDYMSFI